eukprot:CAMPEP_0116886432 /NCGR_PEP_ID=MMETSP0463-20121206/20289_1 /TAXON_ID=181622 /ORGANISM="Strombidinopsis sp, Strain SopsisLIS2011" /LENGTH=64 /DNA_ID=CAMNT_0004546861 /DNA_START=93 /DNA_END=287 /DNA_ORIENTATION=+
MVARRNTVFLEHKAGFNIYHTSEDEYHAYFMKMIYVSAILFGSMIFCFGMNYILAKRDDKMAQD